MRLTSLTPRRMGFEKSASPCCPVWSPVGCGAGCWAAGACAGGAGCGVAGCCAFKAAAASNAANTSPEKCFLVIALSFYQSPKGAGLALAQKPRDAPRCLDYALFQHSSALEAASAAYGSNLAL